MASYEQRPPRYEAITYEEALAGDHPAWFVSGLRLGSIQFVDGDKPHWMVRRPPAESRFGEGQVLLRLLDGTGLVIYDQAQFDLLYVRCEP
jgi:hypothetical protein